MNCVGNLDHTSEKTNEDVDSMLCSMNKITDNWLLIVSPNDFIDYVTNYEHVAVKKPWERTALEVEDELSTRSSKKFKKVFKLNVKIPKFKGIALPKGIVKRSESEQLISLENAAETIARLNSDMKFDPQQLETLLESIHGSNDIKNLHHWPIDAVMALLWNPNVNHVQNPKLLMSLQDETKPISDYFISTSHNTYLLGGQYSVTGGKTTIEAYQQAIESGCRCVELDCYDGANGEPIITHFNQKIGGGMIYFEDAIKCIAKCAFTTTDYPFILNIENHVRNQSLRMAEIITEYFGDRILCADDPVYGHDAIMARTGKLPPLNTLFNRVLCRTKVRERTNPKRNPKIDTEENNTHEHQRTPGKPGIGEVGVFSRQGSFKLKKSKQDSKSKLFRPRKIDFTGDISSVEAGNDVVEQGNYEEPSIQINEKAKDGLAETEVHIESKHSDAQFFTPHELLRLVYFRNVSWKNSQEPDFELKPWHTTSFGENRLNKLTNVERVLTRHEIVEHSSKNLYRTYPKSTALSSQNYNPLPMWCFGCQLVALNFQTQDIYMRIYQAMFRRHQSCGFLLKPEILRTPEKLEKLTNQNIHPLKLPANHRTRRWSDVDLSLINNQPAATNSQSGFISAEMQKSICSQKLNKTPQRTRSSSLSIIKKPKITFQAEIGSVLKRSTSISAPQQRVIHTQPPSPTTPPPKHSKLSRETFGFRKHRNNIPTPETGSIKIWHKLSRRSLALMSSNSTNAHHSESIVLQSKIDLDVRIISIKVPEIGKHLGYKGVMHHLEYFKLPRLTAAAVRLEVKGSQNSAFYTKRQTIKDPCYSMHWDEPLNVGICDPTFTLLCFRLVDKDQHSVADAYCFLDIHRLGSQHIFMYSPQSQKIVARLHVVLSTVTKLDPLRDCRCITFQLLHLVVLGAKLSPSVDESIMNELFYVNQRGCSGCFSSQKMIDPYVVIKLHDFQGRKKYKTQSLSQPEVLGSNNYKKDVLSPVWMTPFILPVAWDEFTFLQFTMKTLEQGNVAMKRRTVCSNTIWSGCIRNGYRVVPLLDLEGNESFRLLCHFQMSAL